MNETPEAYRVEMLPAGAEHPTAHVIDARGVIRRASDAEAWLWAELVKAREQAEALKTTQRRK